MVEPMKSEPVYVSIKVPQPKAPPAPLNLRITARPGVVQLRWDEDRIGQYRYNIYTTGQHQVNGNDAILNVEPVVANSFDIETNVLEDVEYVVETVSKIIGGRSSIIGQPLPPRTGPFFDLAADRGRLVAPAVFDGNELDLSKGGYLVVEPNAEFNVREKFRLECSVKFDEPGEMPVVISHGRWGGAGWFLQKYQGRWRFYADGVVCDGGSPKIGEWLRVVVTFDGLTFQVHENDKLIVQRPASANQSPWTQTLIIGQYTEPASAPHQFKGRIKDVRIW
jgi:hypothetical protein